MSKKRNRWLRQNWAIQREVERVAGEVYGLTTGEGVQCRHISEAGKQCNAAAMRGGYYCKGHTPK